MSTNWHHYQLISLFLWHASARSRSRTSALLCLGTNEGVELLGFQSSVSLHGVELSPKLVRAANLKNITPC